MCVATGREVPFQKKSLMNKVQFSNRICRIHLWAYGERGERNKPQRLSEANEWTNFTWVSEYSAKYMLIGKSSCPKLRTVVNLVVALEIKDTTQRSRLAYSSNKAVLFYHRETWATISGDKMRNTYWNWKQLHLPRLHVITQNITILASLCCSQTFQSN